MFQFSSSVVSNSATPRTATHQASLSITNPWSLLKLMPIESVIPSNHLILCRPLLLPPSIFPRIRVFSNESALRIRAKVLEFQLQHQSFQWIFRADFLSGAISPLISSSTLGTSRRGEFIFQCPIFLPFHTVMFSWCHNLSPKEVLSQVGVRGWECFIFKYLMWKGLTELKIYVHYQENYVNI